LFVAPRLINEAISAALIVFGSPICLRPPLRNTTPMASKTSATNMIKINFVTNPDAGSTQLPSRSTTDFAFELIKASNFC